jgi:hypothetical protein
MNSMELSPYWEAASCAATEEFLNVLWNPKYNYNAHNEPFIGPCPKPA